MDGVGWPDGILRFPRYQRGTARARLNPSRHSLAKQQGETHASAAGSAQRIVAQMLVVGSKILIRKGAALRWIHRGFF
jgi:hypothetical protein